MYRQFEKEKKKQEQEAGLAQHMAAPEGAEFADWYKNQGKPSLSSGDSSSGLGMLAVPAMISGGLGLRAGWKWNEARKPENLLRDAMQQHELMKSRASPTPLQFSLE